MNKKELLAYFDNISLVIISVVLLTLPLFFLTNSTDLFVLPKQLLVIFSTSILLIIWGARLVVERKITVRSNPFNLPVFLFGAVTLISSILSPNMYDSLLQSVPVIFVLFLFFAMVNAINNRNYFSIALSALAIGAVLSSLISVLYYFQIYVLPIPAIQNQYFNPFGSPIQQIAYFLPVLLLSSIYVARKYRTMRFAELKNDYSSLILIGSSVLLLAGIALTIYKIIVLPQKPIVLPMADGFQIALASIAQDTGRMLFSFLFGSGYGTFLTDFARFKSPAFNINANLWNLNFSFSSSYFFELLATTGILGVLSYIFIFTRVLKTRTYPISPLFVALVTTFIVSLLIPYSYTLVFLLFTLLAFHTAYLYLEDDKRVYNISVSLIALKEGLLSFNEEGHNVAPSRRTNAVILPALLFIVIAFGVGFVSYVSTRYIISDTKFAKSLEQSALTDGQKTYNLQREALDENNQTSFPYKSDYYRVFSQVNLALANSVVNNIPQGSSPSAQTQQTVIGLMQQSINAARAAASLAPLSYTNWQNMSGVYRSLIGVGQNAEQFAVASINQAIALNPADPRLYIERGGIFYQLGNYDLAINDFQVAIRLKGDYANAYYNLGHALEMKGDLQNALLQYQIVQQLVRDNSQSVEQIKKEIAALQDKIGKTANNTEPAANLPENTNGQNQEPLEVNEPKNQFPPTDEQVKLPPPPTSGVEQPTPTPSEEK